MAAVADYHHKQDFCGESDQRLVDFARGGSVEAFEAIVLRYRQPLLRHCRRMLTPAEAEDAVQEAFLAAYRSIDRTRPELRLGAWLFRIAHNAALGILGRRVSTRMVEELPSPVDSAHETLMHRERLRDTLSAISRLPETERRVLVESALGGTSQREIAISLGRSEGAVRQLLHRARTTVRDRVAALVPVFARLAATGGDDRFGAGALALKGGAALVLGVTAVGGGAIVLATRPFQPGSHRDTRTRPSTQAVASAPAVGTFSPDDTTAGTRPAPAGSRDILQALRGDQMTKRGSLAPFGAPGAVGIRRRPNQGATTIGRSPTPTPVLGSSAGTSGPNGGRPVAGAPVSGTAPAGPSESQTSTAPAAQASPPGEPASTPGESGTASGPQGASSEQSGAAPGQSGTAPGQSGTTPGQSGTNPGQSGTAQGQSGTAPGQSRVPPGQSGTAPGRSGTAPGQSDTTPRMSRLSPEQSASPSGQSTDVSASIHLAPVTRDVLRARALTL
jgi:RNA polymerase sigma factor (sigma-70 family)